VFETSASTYSAIRAFGECKGNNSFFTMQAYHQKSLIVKLYQD
jgi:hypothetical protein